MNVDDLLVVLRFSLLPRKKQFYEGIRFCILIWELIFCINQVGGGATMMLCLMNCAEIARHSKSGCNHLKVEYRGTY